MPAEARKKADNKRKTDVFGVLPGAETVAKKSPEDVKYYLLPWSVAAICGLSSGAKILYAVLNWMTGGGEICQT